MTKIIRLSSIVVLACLANLSLTTHAETLDLKKYQHAEQQLSTFTDELVTGVVMAPSWSDDGAITV